MWDHRVQNMNRRFWIPIVAMWVWWACNQPAYSQVETASPTPTASNDTPTTQVASQGQFNASPKATMIQFIESINLASDGQESAWPQVYECLELTDSTRAREIALQLWGVINRLEMIDDTTPIPNAQDVVANNLFYYTYFPDPRFDPSIVRLAESAGRITLIKTDTGKWKFSTQTVKDIYSLYARLADLEVLNNLRDERHGSVALWLRSKMPPSWRQGKLLGLEYWQWFGLALLTLVGVTLDHTVRFGLQFLTKRFLAQRHASASGESISIAVRPLGLLVAGLLWLTLLPLLNLPPQALIVLLATVRLFTVLVGTWAAWCITDLVSEVLARKAAKTQTRIDDVLVPLLRKTVKILVIVFGLIYSAAALNIPIVPMLTSLGIGGLAFAFAAKDTIENFFGSVAVVLDRPFEVGDWVVIDDVEGTVEEVGFRSTRIRTFYNSQVTVPNATLVRATVDNYGRRRYRRVKTHIGVQYDTSPEKMIAFTEGIRELVRSHPYTRKDYFQVWFHQFGPSSLDILLYVFHETPDWSTELRERERLFLDIVRLADRLGIQFAFPTQTLHLYQEDSHTTHQPAQPPSKTAESMAMNFGIRTAQELIHQQPWRDLKPEPVQYHASPMVLNDDHDSAVEDRISGS